MTKEEIYNYLDSLNIWYEITNHEALYSMEDVYNANIPYKEYDGKNLFVRDSKKRNYYMIFVKGDKRIDLKKFNEKYNTGKLSFASSEDLSSILSLYPGAVTPLGLLNDKNKIVTLYIDEEFLTKERIVGVHPCDNTATVWMKVDDLISIIENHGNKIKYFKEN